MRPCPLPTALLAFCAAACDRPSPSSGAPSSSAAAAPAPTTAAAPTAPAPAAPDDLNVGELQQTLKCGGKNKSGPCGILAKMAECKPWSGTVPSGDGRWLGRASVVSGGQATEGFAALRLKRASVTDVGPGQLPARISLIEITKDDGLAFEQADRAIRAYERADVPPKSNAAVEHLQRREAWPDAFATRTAGGNVYVIAHGGTFICQGAKNQLLVVQRAATRASGGDGIYAELWATTW